MLRAFVCRCRLGPMRDNTTPFAALGHMRKYAAQPRERAQGQFGPRTGFNEPGAIQRTTDNIWNATAKPIGAGVAAFGSGVTTGLTNYAKGTVGGMGNMFGGVGKAVGNLVSMPGRAMWGGLSGMFGGARTGGLGGALQGAYDGTRGGVAAAHAGVTSGVNQVARGGRQYGYGMVGQAPPPSPRQATPAPQGQPASQPVQ
jgi:hypothetical protein